RDPNIRAADADRERIAEQLRRCHAEGRLDMAEFQERIERCYAAKTHGQLGELVRDLPRHEQERSLARHAPSRLPLFPLIPLLIALAVLAAATRHHFFWLWVPLVFLVLRMSWWRRGRFFAGPRRGPDDWT